MESNNGNPFTGQPTSECTKNPNDVDNGNTTQVCLATNEAISNHLILKQILSHLENPCLVQLSLVNKLWCSTGRSILRSSRKCLAKIHGDEPCKQLLALNNVLLESHDSPYTGISIKVNPFSWMHRHRDDLGEHGLDLYSETGKDESEDSDEEDTDVPVDGALATKESCPVEKLPEDLPQPTIQEKLPEDLPHINIQEKLPEDLPHISIQEKLPNCFSAILNKIQHRHLHFSWERESRCPAQWLLEQVIKKKRHELEELKVCEDSTPRRIGSYQRILGNQDKHWLPSLKFLDVKDLREKDMHIMRELVLAAPQLQSIRGILAGTDGVDLFLEYPQALSIAHTFELFYDSPSLWNDENEYIENESLQKYFSSGPKVEKLNVAGPFDYLPAIHENLTLLQTSLNSVLQRCCVHLRKITLSQFHLLALMALVPAHPLVNVKTVGLSVDTVIDQIMGFHTLPTFDWTGWFPRLEVLKLDIHNVDHFNMKEHLPVEFIRSRDHYSFSCLTLQHIVHGYPHAMDFVELDYFKDLFPNVKSISCRPSCLENAFRFFLVSWPKLEALTLRDYESSVVKNLDKLFCGVSEEEVESLRMKMPESLKNMELPKTPPLLALKKLKRLFIGTGHIRHYGPHAPQVMCSSDEQKNSNSFFASHVSGELAFARMPELSRTIRSTICVRKSECAFSFHHLKPYFDVVPDYIDEQEYYRIQKYY